MKRKYNIEYADNGIVIRDLDCKDCVQVVEYTRENQPIEDDDKVCAEIGRMILQDCNTVTEDTQERGHMIVEGVGFTLEYRAFGRKRKTN